MGHMNAMWYVGKFDEASWQLLARLGLTTTRFRNEDVGMTAASQHIDYKRELRAGDVVSVRSTVLEVRDTSIRITHEMRNDETWEVAATTVIVGVHLDMATKRPRTLPLDVRERACLMIGQKEKTDETVATHADTAARTYWQPVLKRGDRLAAPR
jgi:acyl-CoA thioester hydrolase